MGPIQDNFVATMASKHKDRVKDVPAISPESPWALPWCWMIPQIIMQIAYERWLEPAEIGSLMHYVELTKDIVDEQTQVDGFSFTIYHRKKQSQMNFLPTLSIQHRGMRCVYADNPMFASWIPSENFTHFQTEISELLTDIFHNRDLLEGKLSETQIMRFEVSGSAPTTVNDLIVDLERVFVNGGEIIVRDQLFRIKVENEHIIYSYRVPDDSK